MTKILIDRTTVEQALEALIENARLLGSTQAGKRFGSYLQEDAKFERVCNESIAKHKASIIAALEQPEQSAKWSEFLHYPKCWDTAAYPTLKSAIHETLAWSGCSQCQPAAQPEQEPLMDAIRAEPTAMVHKWRILELVKCYTTPPAQQRKPLTDERILHFVNTHVGGPSPSYTLDSSDWINFARAVEAAHGIKEQ